MRISATSAATPALKNEMAQAVFISLMPNTQKPIMPIAAMAMKTAIKFSIFFIYFNIITNAAATAVIIPSRYAKSVHPLSAFAKKAIATKQATKIPISTANKHHFLTLFFFILIGFKIFRNNNSSLAKLYYNSLVLSSFKKGNAPHLSGALYKINRTHRPVCRLLPYIWARSLPHTTSPLHRRSPTSKDRYQVSCKPDKSSSFGC